MKKRKWKTFRSKKKSNRNLKKRNEENSSEEKDKEFVDHKTKDEKRRKIKGVWIVIDRPIDILISNIRFDIRVEEKFIVEVTSRRTNTNEIKSNRNRNDLRKEFRFIVNKTNLYSKTKTMRSFVRSMRSFRKWKRMSSDRGFYFHLDLRVKSRIFEKKKHFFIFNEKNIEKTTICYCEHRFDMLDMFRAEIESKEKTNKRFVFLIEKKIFRWFYKTKPIRNTFVMKMMRTW